MSPEVSGKVTNFFEQYRQQHFEKGQVLIQAGEQPTGILFLEQGQVRQYDISPSGEQVVVNIFKPPAFFPMSWALNKSDNNYFYETFTPVVLRKAPADDVVRFLQTNPDVVLDLLSRVYRGMDGLLGRMVYLMENSSRNRLLFELLLSADRFGKPIPGGGVYLALSESELATRVGLARETVNREMRAIKKDGLVTVGLSGITIKEPQALRDQLNK